MSPTPHSADRVVGGRYRLLRPIATLAATTLFEAESAPGGPRVAVELSNQPLAPGAIARARRELEVIARLRHPNVLAILDAIDDGGHLAIVTEPPGAPLAASPQGPALVGRLLAALEAAHAAGVAHGSVGAPRVSMVGDLPKLGGFGVAIVERGEAAVLEPRADVAGAAQVLAATFGGAPPAPIAELVARAAAGGYASAQELARALDAASGAPPAGKGHPRTLESPAMPMMTPPATATASTPPPGATPADGVPSTSRGRGGTAASPVFPMMQPSGPRPIPEVVVEPVRIPTAPPPARRGNGLLVGIAIATVVLFVAGGALALVLLR